MLALIQMFEPLSLFGQTFRDTSLVHSLTIHFDIDSSALSRDDSIELANFIKESKRLKNITYEIEAHTDSDGSNDYNIELSERRAETVHQFMLEKGVSREIIKVSFHGENKPIVQNKSAHTKKLNRRATIRRISNIRIWEFSGTIISENEEPIEDAEVLLHSLYFRDTTYTDRYGKFTVTSPFNEVIGLDVIAKGHFFESKMMRAHPQFTDSLRIFLPEVSIDRIFEVERFLFVGDRAIILEEFKGNLTILERFLWLDPEVCIEIVGHVNEPGRPPVDSVSFEYNLSVARSKLIFDEMVARGISPERMVYSGKGNWEMVYPKAKTAEEMKKNRRVEIVIRDCEYVKNRSADPLDLKFDFYSYPQVRRKP